MKILKSTFLCHTENCCPSVNLTDKGTFLIGGTKTNAEGKIMLPIAEYLNATSEFQKPEILQAQKQTEDAEFSGNFVIFSGRTLQTEELSLLAKPLDASEGAIEVTSHAFWSLANKVAQKAA